MLFGLPRARRLSSAPGRIRPRRLSDGSRQLVLICIKHLFRSPEPTMNSDDVISARRYPGKRRITFSRCELSFARWVQMTPSRTSLSAWASIVPPAATWIAMLSAVTR